MTEPIQLCGNDVVRSMNEPEVTQHWSVAFGETRLLATLVQHYRVPLDTGTLIFGQITAPIPSLSSGGEFAELRSDTHVIATAWRGSPFAPFEAGSNEARTRQLVGRKIDKVWALKDGWRGPGSLAPTPAAREIYLAAVQALPGRCLPMPSQHQRALVAYTWSGHGADMTTRPKSLVTVNLS